MTPQLYCPCCGKKAMNIWQKLVLTRLSTRPCRSCGQALSVEKAPVGWFILGWIPFSLSGLFPLPIKLVLGGIGLILMISPYLYRVPLVARTEGVEKRFPRWLTIWLPILFIGMFASDWVNLIPSTEAKVFALCISVMLALLILKEVWNRISEPDGKLLAIALGLVLLAGAHYFALRSLPPALATYFSGESGITHATVARKSHTNKLTRCSNKIDVIFEGDDIEQEICVGELIWKKVRKNDLVTIRFRETAFGRLVTAVEADG